MSDDDTAQPKKRAPTSGTRHGTGAGHGGPATGAGAWGDAVGGGWGGDVQSRSSGTGLTREQRRARDAAWRNEMIGIYLSIARDPAQHPALRLQAARHLLARLDNPFLDLLYDL